MEITDRGRRQAKETAEKLREEEEVPEVIFLSSYIRAVQTYDAMREAWPELPDPSERNLVYQDSRLRELEMGRAVFAGDWSIFFALNPDEKRLRDSEGMFYYRYPNGENIADVMLRTRSWLDMLTRDYSKKRVLVVLHLFSALAIRANLERWDSEKFEEMDTLTRRGGPPLNCGVTAYRGDPEQGDDGRLVLDYENKKFFTD